MWFERTVVGWLSIVALPTKYTLGVTTLTIRDTDAERVLTDFTHRQNSLAVKMNRRREDVKRYRPRHRQKPRHWRRVLLTTSQTSLVLTSAIGSCSPVEPVSRSCSPPRFAPADHQTQVAITWGKMLT